MKRCCLMAIVSGCVLVLSHNALAVQLAGESKPTCPGTDGSTYVATLPTRPEGDTSTYVATLPSDAEASGTFSRVGTTTSNLAAFNISIVAGPGLQTNGAALAAFNRAAAQWEARISNPITITIDADMADLGTGGIIGQSSSVVLQAGYTTIRNAVVASAALEPDDGIVASLPTGSQFSVYLPSGIGLNGTVVGTKANLKALNFTGLDSTFGVSDGTIEFNTNFAFDYDNSDGVASETMDFETVAAHEIGHALGFISSVDDIDYYRAIGGTASIGPTTLDLFRFGNSGSDNPSTASQFTTFPRSLVPNRDEITDQITSPWGTLTSAEFRMSTGAYTGDGSQASHWKDDLGIGIMDPTLTYEEVVGVSEADLRAFDLIGYNISPVPEPGTLAMFLVAGACVLAVRRRNVR